jgi:uncharacterized protein with PQ loop repeat
MNGFRKIFPIFLSHYAIFFAKMAERKIVPFDEFYYQLKLMHLFQKHPVCSYHWYVIIFNIQILFHKIEFQLCVSKSA